MHSIQIANDQSAISIDADEVQRLVEHLLTLEQVTQAALSVALVTDAVSHRVNRAHLGHDYPTDVISFLFESTGPDQIADASLIQPRGAGLSLDGELVISTDTAVRCAREHAWSDREELYLYIVHGLLHLCGYDDQSPEQRSLMRDRERAVLAAWNIRPQHEE